MQAFKKEMTSCVMSAAVMLAYTTHAQEVPATAAAKPEGVPPSAAAPQKMEPLEPPPAPMETEKSSSAKPPAADAAKKPSAAKPKDGAPPPTVRFATIATVSDIPAVYPVLLIRNLFIALGIGFRYDGNGLLDSTGMRTEDKVSFGTNLYFGYIVLQKGPLFLYPTFSWFTTFAPGDPLSVNVLNGGFAFSVAPWAAPVFLGAAWNARVTLIKGASPTFDLFSPALTIGYFIK